MQSTSRIQQCSPYPNPSGLRNFHKWNMVMCETVRPSYHSLLVNILDDALLDAYRYRLSHNILQSPCFLPRHNIIPSRCIQPLERRQRGPKERRTTARLLEEWRFHLCALERSQEWMTEDNSKDPQDSGAGTRNFDQRRGQWRREVETKRTSSRQYLDCQMEKDGEYFFMIAVFRCESKICWPATKILAHLWLH